MEKVDLLVNNNVDVKGSLEFWGDMNSYNENLLEFKNSFSILICEICASGKCSTRKIRALGGNCLESKVTMPSARAGKHSVAKTEKSIRMFLFIILPCLLSLN